MDNQPSASAVVGLGTGAMQHKAYKSAVFESTYAYRKAKQCANDVLIVHRWENTNNNAGRNKQRKRSLYNFFAV